MMNLTWKILTVFYVLLLVLLVVIGLAAFGICSVFLQGLIKLVNKIKS